MKPSDRSDIYSAIRYLEDAGRWIKADARAGDHKAYEFAQDIEHVARRAKEAFDRLPKL